MKIKILTNKKYSICSCGLSKKLPFCDNTHREYNTENNSNYKSVKITSNKNIELDITSSTWDNNDKKNNSINVYNKPLETCCNDPKTGFFRDGKCNTCKEDLGLHTVCILATEEFLIFSKSIGNNLSTPNIMNLFVFYSTA